MQNFALDYIKDIEFKKFLFKINVQRSSPDGRVEPQANGGRKMLF